MTATKFEELKYKVLGCETFFDFIVVLYLTATDENQSVYMSSYEKWIKQESYGKIYTRNKKIISMMCEFNVHFKELVNDWVGILEENHENVFPHILDTLYQYDYLIADSMNKSREFLEKCGPLNSPKSQESALFFLSKNSYLQKEVIESNRILLNRNATMTNPTGIGAALKNYIILKKNILGGKLPSLVRYNPKGRKGTFDVEALNIAVVPFYFSRWFDTVIKDNIFEVYDINEQKQYINNAYINALIGAEKNKCDVIIFPEMSMNQDTLKSVTEYIRRNYGAFKNLKLIFTGSVWNDNTNCAYVLSGSGTVLIKTCKKEPFSYFDKERNAEVRENLLNCDREMQMLDVDGIGRITYSICRDGTDDLQNNIKGYLRTTINVISSYSNKLTPFDNIMEGLAKNKTMISIFANCCAAMQKETSDAVGFICFPKVDTSKKIVAETVYYSRDNKNRCFEYCEYCKCMEMFNLALMKEEGGSGKKNLLCTQKLLITD